MLIFLHTSPNHINTFNTLLAHMAPEIPARHIVDESLLHMARVKGLNKEIQQRVDAAILSAVRWSSDVVLCTCSTIGTYAEGANRLIDNPILRVDRAMAEQAVLSGSPMVIVATLASTLAPTKALIVDAALTAQKTVGIIEMLVERAWPKFEQGDQTGYFECIADTLYVAASIGRIIVLAQASMAGAVDLCPDITVPIL
ncbi:MAG: hypothetical protein KDJ52_27445, partial [Anaerolineae bacterium]|nr:hypothetical protein [Anaerolineae bacterium]